MSDACIAQGAVDAIQKLAPGFVPTIALTLGSGCGDVANAIEDAITIDYSSIPGFPISSVQGHAGQLILGKLGGVNVVGLKGRVHYYEGNPRAMVIPVYTAKLLGAKTIFITNAAGSLREEMGPGALVTPPPPPPETRYPKSGSLIPEIRIPGGTHRPHELLRRQPAHR